MSSLWSWWVIIGTVVSMIACVWLIVFTNRQRASKEEIAESEAHVWDEDIRELNNPLPMWWLWLFILTIIWSVGYLIYYPGLGTFSGTSEWTQEGQYDAEVAAAEARYGPIFAKYGAMEVPELVNDPKALGIGKSLFANYCSQCHGSTAQGARSFPDLTDDDDYETIGGLVMHELGRLPRLGESLAFSGFVFRVTKADRRRIDALQVNRIPEESVAAG